VQPRRQVLSADSHQCIPFHWWQGRRMRRASVGRGGRSFMAAQEQCPGHPPQRSSRASIVARRSDKSCDACSGFVDRSGILSVRRDVTREDLPLGELQGAFSEHAELPKTYLSTR
jgi:hypothetical protein